MPAKPRKPYPSFPLTPHVRGGWAKSYKGKQLYIAEPDPKKAMTEFNRMARQIDMGRAPSRPASRVARTVKQVANLYLNDRLPEVKAGAFSRECYLDYRDSLRRMLKCFGDEFLVADLTPDMFAELGRFLAKTTIKTVNGKEVVKKLGPYAMARHIQAIRSVFRHAHLNLWIPESVNFGTRFSKPPLPKKAGNPLTTEELQAVLKACPPGPLKTAVLVMANCAYTPRDLAMLPVDCVHISRDESGSISGGLITFPRPKMARRRPIDRAAVLWPETAQELAELMRAGERDGEKSGYVFRAQRGGQIRTDVMSRRFSDLCAVAGIAERGPAWIRHWFRTVADELDAPTPVARVMGHRLAGMAEVYVDRVEHDRIKRVCDYVGARLLGPILGPVRRPESNA